LSTQENRLANLARVSTHNFHDQWSGIWAETGPFRKGYRSNARAQSVVIMSRHNEPYVRAGLGRDSQAENPPGRAEIKTSPVCANRPVGKHVLLLMVAFASLIGAGVVIGAGTLVITIAGEPPGSSTAALLTMFSLIVSTVIGLAVRPAVQRMRQRANAQ
jgi:hypothetical protein